MSSETAIEFKAIKKGLLDNARLAMITNKKQTYDILQMVKVDNQLMYEQ